MKFVIAACFCHRSCGVSYVGSLASLSFSKIVPWNTGHDIFLNISQGSVATCSQCGGGIFSDRSTASFLQSVPVKEFLQSVNICRRYG